MSLQPSAHLGPATQVVRWARFVLASVFLEGVLLFGGVAFIPTHLHAA